MARVYFSVGSGGGVVNHLQVCRGDFAACAIGMLAARNMAPPEEMRVFNTLI
jgi:hypothetical protein